MAGRRSHLAAVVLVVACELVSLGLAPAQETAPAPTESAPLDDTRAAQSPAPVPQPKMARIWANEPPLVRLARDHFGDKFTDTDARFFAAVAANEWADFRPAPDAKFNAEQPSSWAQAPTLQADRIAWLCTDAAALRLVPNHGIWLRGASIEGQISLYRADIPFSLTMFDCLLDGGMNLEHANVQEIDIRNSCSAMIAAKGVEVKENIYLIQTCIYGGMNFVDAHIAGDFDFTGGLASIGMPNDEQVKPGVALSFRDAKIGGDIRLAENFRARGQVYMFGAQVGRSLVCTNGEFLGAGSTAINAQRCQFGASVELDDSFKADGGVDLRRSHIGSDLDCDGGRFIACDVDALNADMVDVGAQVYLGDGFHAEGEVRMISAVVAGDVDCDNGHFIHPAGDALSLDSTEIGRSLRIGIEGSPSADADTHLPAGFVARGTVRLWGAKINQDILGSGAVFETPQGVALMACNLSVESRVVLMDAEVRGIANFFNAEISHEFDCRGAHFDGSQTADRVAFVGNGMHVHGHLYFNRSFANGKVRDFSIDGWMSMAFASIDMHWELDNARFSNPGRDTLDASDCRVGGYVNLDRVAIDGRASFSRAKIDGMWILLNTVQPERTQLDMRFAHIWVIKDDRLSDWPPAGKIQLEGLVYDHFDDDSPLTVEDRLAWLRRQYMPVGAGVDEVKSDVDLIDGDQQVQRSRIINGEKIVGRQVAADRVTPIGYEENSTDQPPAAFSAVPTAAPTTGTPAEPDAMVAPGMQAPGPIAGLDEPEQMSTADDDDPSNDEEVEGFATAQQSSPAPPPAPDPASRRYLTQPYTQLASVYRAIGQDEEANAVLVARAQRIGELSPLLSAQGLWYRYLGRLIGYGYEPFRAIKIGVAIVVIGTIVFALGARRNLMAETKLAELVISQENETRLVSATYPRFNPLVYSLDVFLPFVDLQQICYWLPGERTSGPHASRNCLLHIGRWSLKWSGMLRTYFWFQTLAGWTLCTLLAAAVTGIVES